MPSSDGYSRLMSLALAADLLEPSLNGGNRKHEEKNPDYSAR
jgi:hypothetical protein